jgi:hypothetical protein
MQSAYALIQSLGVQQTALKDIQFRLENLQFLVRDLLQALHFAKASLQQEVKLGPLQAGLNPAALFEQDKNFPIDAQLLDGVFQVEGAWPFIKAKVDRTLEACKAGNEQAEIAQVLAAELLSALRAAEVTQNFDNIDRTALAAFNSDMAQLDSRVVVLDALVASLVKDTQDMMEIFGTIRGEVEKYRIQLANIVQKALDALLNLSHNIAGVVAEIRQRVMFAKPAALIHPQDLEPPPLPPSRAEAESHLAEALKRANDIHASIFPKLPVRP